MPIDATTQVETHGVGAARPRQTRHQDRVRTTAVIPLRFTADPFPRAVVIGTHRADRDLVEVRNWNDGVIVLVESRASVHEWLMVFGYEWQQGSNGIWRREGKPSGG